MMCQGSYAHPAGKIGQKLGRAVGSPVVALLKERSAGARMFMKIDVLSSYLQSQAALAQQPHEPQLAITISREVGAGGRTIAELVAQRLTALEKTPAISPWAVFDANLAKQVLEDHKLPPDLERFVTEDAKITVEGIVEEVLKLHPAVWTLVEHTTKTILRLASLGHVIVVGRGGNVITARLANVFHVRLVAPLGMRIRHTAEYYHLNEAEAAKFVREHDDARRRYVRRYFDAEIDDPTLYDATLNTRRFGFDGAAEVIAQMALQHRYTDRLLTLA
jgi:cytidylate kinase